MFLLENLLRPTYLQVQIDICQLHYSGTDKNNIFLSSVLGYHLFFTQSCSELYKNNP